MITEAVKVDRLSKIYEPTPKWMRALVRSHTIEPVVALHEVSFDVSPGEILVIIGPNGAGKSTLFRVLTGLTTASSGQTSVLGMDPATEGHRIRSRLGFMPAEDRTLFLRHSCRENLRFHGRLQGLAAGTLNDAIDASLTLVGLWEVRDRTGFALSSGMRARLMLARAILHSPEVLILDEPTGAIDPIAAHEFLEMIMEITADRGMATLVSSHRLEEIDALKENALLLDRGRVIHSGKLDEVRATSERTYEVRCTHPEATIRVARSLRALGAVVSEPNGQLILVGADDLGTAAANVLRVGDDIESITLRKLSLRETIAVLLSEGRQ